MLTDTIYMLHSLTQLQHDKFCITCKRMENAASDLLYNLEEVASSDIGRNSLFEQMINGNENVKNIFVLNIPYVIK